MAHKGTRKGITRRSFIKGVAIGAGAAAAAGSGLLGARSRNNALAAIPTGAGPISTAGLPASWDHKTDVLVLGAGGAGLAAAVAAGETGAKVMVLEKNPSCGGDTATAMVFMSRTRDSRFHKRLGMKPIPLSAAFAQGTAGFACRNNCEVERTIIARDGATADWLEDMGVVYYPGPAAGAPPGFMLTPQDPDGGYYRWFPHNAKGFTQRLEKRARDLSIRFFLATPATTLVTKAGRVMGVTAKTEKGETLNIKARVTVLATGGFGANKAMLEKYALPVVFAGIAHYIGLPSATGDGIRMAQGVGAVVEGMDDFEMWDGGPPGVGEGPMSFYNAATQLVRQKSLTVNKLGKRFMDESLLYGHGHEIGAFKSQAFQTIRQKDQTSFTIHDSDTVKKDFIIKRFEPVACEYPCPWYEKDFKRRVKEGIIIKADSIGDLARLMDIDPKALEETLNNYNKYCDKKTDPEFFKPAKYLIPIRKPPFYAVKQVGGALFNTWGGLVTNTRFEVLDKDWKPIPGLRVAGENAAYCASVVYAITSGRIAGENAAREALWK
ncbi:MAG: FAD-dependent oxidoreductase [Thermodesulfobacteriota bacterium]|nr:FAD-dependent oxidoreductase [Thermodesulfobacteriota bacterium]